MSEPTAVVAPGIRPAHICHQLLTALEVSDGTIALDHGDKRALIERLAGEGFTVLSEVGSKDAMHIMAPYRWVELIAAELQAGSWKVICEGRESGTVGIFHTDGGVKSGVIDEIVHRIDPSRLIFEAPQKAQQVWFVQKFGSDVNLGNIATSDRGCHA